MENSTRKITFADLGQIIVFGLNPKTKEFIYIDNCENGLKCGLVCSFCGNQLSAKNNCELKRNHFAHKAGSDCRKGHESTIPLLFKKVLEESNTVHLPRYCYPFDSSIYYEYGKVHIENIELEKYEDDLSFNVIVKTSSGMRIAFIPFMKSNNITLRKYCAAIKYDYVLTIDFTFYKNSHDFIEDVIKEITEQGRHQHLCSWAKNKEEANLKAEYDLRCKKMEAERQQRSAEELEKKKNPIIDNGIEYYRIEGIESFSSNNKKIRIISKEYHIEYLIDFTIQYKTDDGYLKGYRVDDDGVVYTIQEVIKYQRKSLWQVCWSLPKNN